MLRNFRDTSIKIHIEDVQRFVVFQISLDFFIFFLTETRKIAIDALPGTELKCR